MTSTQQAHEQMNRIYMTLVAQHKWNYTAYYITRVHSMQSMQKSNKTSNTHQRAESTNDYSHPILQHNLSVTYIHYQYIQYCTTTWQSWLVPGALSVALLGSSSSVSLRYLGSFPSTRLMVCPSDEE